MRLLHFEPASGASGDMILGALLALGEPAFDIERLRAALAAAKLPAHELKAAEVLRGGLSGTHLEVIPREKDPPHRTLADLLALIGNAGALPERARTAAERVLRRLAEVEGKGHGKPPEEIRFHEGGALDTLVDVLGACLGFAALGWPGITVGPLAVGSGVVKCAHGTLPVPAPAVAELIRGWPVAGSNAEGELLTPTGAAILTTLGRPSPALPPMTVRGVGCAAGTKELGHAAPNLLRVFLGETSGAGALAGAEEGEPMVRVEAVIDDMPAELFGHLFESLAAAGAVEVAELPATLKKSRPGTLLVVLVPQAQLASLAEALFRETTTFGLRHWPVGRMTLAREHREVRTKGGAVRVKLGRLGGAEGEVVTRSPEYEDCRKLAESAGASLREVYEAAKQAAEG